MVIIIKYSDNSDNSTISDNDNNNVTSSIPLDVFFLHYAWTYLNCFFSLNSVICSILRDHHTNDLSAPCYFFEKELEV